MPNFEIRNVAKAARHSTRYLSKLYIKFPFNDYVRGGRVKACNPYVWLKPEFRKNGTVRVRFANRIWQLTAHTWDMLDSNAILDGKGALLLKRENGTRFSAQIAFVPHAID